MKSGRFSILFVLLLVLILSGCGQPDATPEVSATQTNPPTQPPPTQTPQPPATQTPEPEPTQTPTSHPLGTQTAVVPVENLNLRAGPGTTYAILASYPTNTQLLVLSRVPGDEWVRVQLADEKIGWMSAELLGLGENAAYLPLEDVTDSIMVSGRVIDSTGKPVDKVNIAVMQRLKDGTLRTDAVSNADGYWYAYIPKESVGIWEVQVVGTDCASWIYDSACNNTGHFLYNYRFIFEPPPSSPFLFMYQTADAFITGQVTNAEGTPVSIRVFAERTDGAYVYVVSNEAGQFSLPVGAGSWKVYSMQYNPNLEGESVTVQVQSGVNPEPVYIKAPVKKE